MNAPSYLAKCISSPFKRLRDKSDPLFTESPWRASVLSTLKSVGPKLVPFCKSVAVYFVLFIPTHSPSWFACLIKILPIISLIVFVLLHGMNFTDQYAYSRRIICGLVFSMIGDAFLIWKPYFIHGLCSFGIAHLFYCSAFGFRPLKLSVGIGCFVVCSIITAILLPFFDGLGIFHVFVPLYAYLLMMMVWRGIARVQLFNDMWTWTTLCGCIGAMLFCISDTIIAFNFFAHEIPYSQALIMTTYYAAQVGIALSVVNSMEQNFESEELKRTTCSISEEYLKTDTKLKRVNFSCKN